MQFGSTGAMLRKISLKNDKPAVCHQSSQFAIVLAIALSNCKECLMVINKRRKIRLVWAEAPTTTQLHWLDRTKWSMSPHCATAVMISPSDGSKQLVVSGNDGLLLCSCTPCTFGDKSDPSVEAESTVLYTATTRQLAIKIAKCYCTLSESWLLHWFSVINFLLQQAFIAECHERRYSWYRVLF